MKQLKLSRLFSLLLALTLALTPCLAGLAEEGTTFARCVFMAFAVFNIASSVK